MQTGIAVAFCLVLSVLSWRWIEQPMLRRSWVADRKSLLWLSGALAFVLVFAGVGVAGANGFPQRFPASIRTMLAIVTRRGFAPFGWLRIAIGVVGLLLIYRGVV